mmetsp:Transcript_80301/g.260100  ORF Transcript_80301/g.260100 Transcript_80301/m.260100 type:complete len:293 (+) Transcript_80301:1768-2646(+)
MDVVGHVGLAPVEDRVAKALVRALHVHLPADAALQPRLGPFQHLLPHLHVLVQRLVAPSAGHALVSLRPHGVDVRVVHVRLPALDHVLHDLLQVIKVVRSVGPHVRVDLQRRQVLDDALLELHLLLAGVRVVEPEDELAVVVPGVVVVQHGSLGVPDVQVAARLRREARAHLPILRVREQPLQASLVLSLRAAALLVCALGSTRLWPLPQREGGLQCPELLDPPPSVGKGLHVGSEGDLLEALEVLLSGLRAPGDEGPRGQMLVELLDAGLRLQAAKAASHQRGVLRRCAAD